MGDNMVAQQALLREDPDVVISTPAKLVAHLEAGNLKIKDTVETLGTAPIEAFPWTLNRFDQ